MSIFSPPSPPFENNFASPHRAQEAKFRQRALWTAVLLLLLLGFILAFAVYQLAQSDFEPQNTAAYYIFTSILISLLLVIIGAVLVLRWRISLGLNFVYYSGFLPVLTAAFLFSGRGITAAFTLGIISIIIIFFVYPPNKRKIPFYVLLGTISVAGILDFIDPAFRTKLPTDTLVGPAGSILFVLVFLGVLFNQAWKSFNVRAKLISSISVLSIILIGVLTLNSIRNLFQQAEVNEQQQLTSAHNYYNSYVASLEDTASSLAVSIADRQDVLDLLRARNRQGLINLLTPVFNTLENDYNIVHMYVEEPDGSVFVRIHNSESFGDDVTYRNTVADAISTKSSVAGVDIGPIHLGVHGIAPIFDGNQLVGLTEVGLDYDQAFIDGLKSNTNIDYTMWVAHEAAAPAGLKPIESDIDAPIPELFFYASTYNNSLPVPEEAYERVLESGKPETHYVSDGEQNLVVLVAPLVGYGERTIGVFEIISSRTQVLANIQQELLNSLGVAALVSLIGFTALLLISQTVILQPINKLTTTSRQQLAGDLSARIPHLGNDEFGELGSTLNTLTENLQSLVTDLEQRVEERTVSLEQANQQVQNRAEQFEAIAQISRVISSIQNHEELLNRITRMISQYFGFYHVGIFLLDDNKRFAILEAANSEGGQRMLNRGHRLEVGQTGIVGYVTSTGNPRIALDTGADAVYFDNPDLPETRSEMALPLKGGGQIVGALDVQSTEPNAFSQEDVNILSTLADQVSASLENVRLYEEAQGALFKAEAAYRQLTGEAWSDIHRFSSLTGYRFDGTKAEPLKMHTNSGQSEGQKEAFSIPVQLRGETIGKLRINPTTKKHKWTQDEVVIIQATAERVALAVENARLVSESIKRASKEQIIGEASSKISSAINLDNILQTALREMGRIIPGADISIQVENE